MCTINEKLEQHELYYRHLKGECICVTCNCGGCRCPFQRKTISGHLKGRTIYQGEFTTKVSTKDHVKQLQLEKRNDVPLETFQIKQPFRSTQRTKGIFPERRETPILEEFSRESSYASQFKQYKISMAEPIKPVNSIQIIRNPMIYKTNYSTMFKKHKLCNQSLELPNAHKNLIGSSINYSHTSNYSQDFSATSTVMPRSTVNSLREPLSLSFKGQFDSLQKRSYQPYLIQLCPAKQQLTQNKNEYSQEQQKLHL